MNKKQITIISASRGTTGVELVFTQDNGVTLETAVISGAIMESALTGAELYNIPETYRKLGGAKMLADITYAKAGQTALDKAGKVSTDEHGQPIIYKKDHVRLSGLTILNGQEIYDSLDLKSIEKDAIMARSTQITFERKNPISAIKSSLLGSSKPPVNDNAPEIVDETLITEKPSPKSGKGAAQNVLENSETAQ